MVVDPWQTAGKQNVKQKTTPAMQAKNNLPKEVRIEAFASKA